MKKIRKLLLISVLVLILVFSVTTLVACQEEENPNDFVNGQGNTVRVILDCTRDPLVKDSVDKMPSSCYIDYRIKPGSPIPEPGVTKNTTAPSVDGYVFDGYYEGFIDTDGVLQYGNKWDFSKPINEDLTLYGKWLIQYKIRIVYVLDGVKQDKSEDVNVSANAAQVTSVKSPSWSGNTYVQTYTNPECTEELVVSRDKPFIHGCTQENPVREVYAKFIAGTWTLIRTADNLRTIRSGDNLYLMNDVDMSSLNNTNGYTEMSIPNTFSGAIEGNGYKISNLNYLREGKSTLPLDYTSYCFGLFARLNGASIKNITFENCSVQGVVQQQNNEYFYGFLAGQAEKCEFDNIKFVGCTLNTLQFKIKNKTLTAEEEAAEREKIEQNFFVGEGSNYSPEIVEAQNTQSSAINLLANEYALLPNLTNKFC